MKVRDLEARDIPILQEWHRQSGFDYSFPDLTDPVFASIGVLVDENDQPIMAIAGRKTAEMYLLLDSTWRNPRWRLEGFAQLHESMRRRLLSMGFEDSHCWLPPQIDKSFGKRLTRLFGWIKSGWSSYSRRLEK